MMNYIHFTHSLLYFYTEFLSLNNIEIGKWKNNTLEFTLLLTALLQFCETIFFNPPPPGLSIEISCNAAAAQRLVVMCCRFKSVKIVKSMRILYQKLEQSR